MPNERETIQIPKDVKEMTEKYKIDKGGICGQSCLAVIEGTTIQEVMDNWKVLGLEFKDQSQTKISVFLIFGISGWFGIPNFHTN